MAEEFDPDVGSKPLFEAPTIASLMRQMAARPAWAVDAPLETDEATFEQAWIEMREIQRRQGRSIAVAPWVKERNFLLRGVPVVSVNG